jgi:hypothetical protein
MATCPRCLGPLTDDHRCPRGRFSRISDAVTTVAVGAILGGGLCMATVDDPAAALVLASAALGAVLVRALRDAIGPHL